MSLLENELSDNMHPSELKHIRDISSGAYGRVIETLHKPTNRIFAMKLLEISEDCPEQVIRNEIKFLSDINKNPQKPSIFPNFYGFFLNFDETSGKRLFGLLFDLKKQTLNDLINNSKKPITFVLFKNAFLKLINGLAYLQTLQICHRDLKPQNILLDDEKANNFLSLTLIDFGVSKQIIEKKQGEITQEMTIIGTENYFSPELRDASIGNGKIEINPYKSDVFSLGLVMVKLAKKKLPKDYKDIDKILYEIESMFISEPDIFEEKRSNIKKIMSLLKTSLEIDPKMRPDFMELFYKSLKLEENLENIRNLILFQDFGFSHEKREKFESERSDKEIEFHEKPEKTIIPDNFLSRVRTNNECENQELFVKIDAFFQKKSVFSNFLNIVIMGDLKERFTFFNKILRFLGFQEDLLELPENFADLSPFYLEIQGQEQEKNYETEYSLNLGKKTNIKTDNLKEFKQNLNQIFSQNSIIFLKSTGEKPFIYQRVSIKTFNSAYNFILVSQSFQNERFSSFLNKKLKNDKNPVIFLSIKPFEMKKYDPYYLPFCHKLQRKLTTAIWTLFINEKGYLQNFQLDEKDNEKTLISKKNQKITEFEKILKFEEETLKTIFCEKSVFFLDFQENSTFTRIFAKFSDFLNKSICEKAMFMMLEDGKLPISDVKSENVKIKEKGRFELTKIIEIQEKSQFFLSGFEPEIEMFFDKLTQGSIVNMRKNISFFSELEELISSGVQLVSNTQNFYNEKSFVRTVFQTIKGSLQEFFRKQLYQLIYPFIEALIKQAIDTFGIKEIENLFNWILSEGSKETASDYEKLIIGLLMRNPMEFPGKLSEKLMMWTFDDKVIPKGKKTLKSFQIQENVYNQLKSSPFWSYQASKNDILEIVINSVRFNKSENITHMSEILQAISKEFIEKLTNFPEEREIHENNAEILILQKNLLKAIQSFNFNNDMIFCMDNLKEIEDQGLKEVLLVKANKTTASVIKKSTLK